MVELKNFFHVAELQVQSEGLSRRPDHSPPQGQRQCRQSGRLEGVALRLPHFRQYACHFLLPVLFLRSRNVGRLPQSFPHRRVESALEPGHDSMAHPVARVAKIAVAGVLAPILANFSQVFFQKLAPVFSSGRTTEN